MNYVPSCPLCVRKKLTEWLWEDDICFICKCIDCGGWQIVLKHHGEPTEKEFEHMKIIGRKVFPDKRWRGYRRKIQEHFHEHFV